MRYELTTATAIFSVYYLAATAAAGAAFHFFDLIWLFSQSRFSYQDSTIFKFYLSI